MPGFERYPQVRLQPTRDGGRAFRAATATTVELDREAYQLLSLLEGVSTARELRPRVLQRVRRNVTVAELDILLREFARLGFVRVVEGSSPKSTSGSALQTCDANCVPPPESVHLQLNNVCNLRCPSCYVGLQKEDVGSLPLARLLELVDEFAEMGVFQLALGGGEPLMSPKLAPVARRAREHGLLPNVTTNGWLLTPELLDDLGGAIGEFRMSLNDTVASNTGLLADRAALLRSRNARFGFNLIVTRENLPRLDRWLRWACDQGAASVTLIRPKPAPGNEAWYARCALGPEESRRLVQVLREVEPLFETTALAVDCAFSFVFQGWTPEALRAHGVTGCAMGERFAIVAWNGDVYPCSHLRGEEFRAGSVSNTSFRRLWEQSTAFRRLRHDLPLVEGHCGSCGHATACKGCRAVMQQTGNWLAADQDCVTLSHQFSSSRLQPGSHV